MFDPSTYLKQAANALIELIRNTTDKHVSMLPTEWAEDVRVLPRSVTAQPGPFSWEPTPYWREVIDCMSQESPVRFIAVKKGAQVAATVGLLENVIGYYIDHVKHMPILFYTADKELADLRMDDYIIPMIEYSGLSDRIQSNDAIRIGKQGLTAKRMSWVGGGYLLPLGALNSNKMRSISGPILLRDEVSGWPLRAGSDGDPMKLTETRTNSFEMSRKILDLSTPTLSGTCAVTKRYELGDKRQYEVPCVHCGHYQVLRFRGRNEKGDPYGLVWDMNGPDTIRPGSVKYACIECGGLMVNEDKIRFMSKGRWVPTATPKVPNFRSYHISALYAPFFARTWEAIAVSWIEAWDDEQNSVRDVELLQVFYNNDLGEPYDLVSDRIKPHQVSPHRRAEYRLGEIPLDHPVKHAGGPIQLLTMSVDVQKKWLAVAVFGWAASADKKGYSAYLIDYYTIEGDCENASSEVWAALRKDIDEPRYGDFLIPIALIDSSYLTDVVYTFCSQWESGVYPLRGRDKPTKSARFREFEMRENSTGTRYAMVTVDTYKDRWSAALRKDWNGLGDMPRNAFSAPCNLSDKALNELTVEYRKEKRCPRTGRLEGTFWHRPGNARQELWDLLGYNTAAIEMLAFDLCSEGLGLDHLSWPDFWREAEKGLYY